MSRSSAKKSKTLTVQARRGQEGINLIEKIVLEMGSMWSPTGGIEVGIDGYIELFDRNTGEALGKTLAVQSKVLKDFQNESDEGFDYNCGIRDLEYWLQGNMPVLLIISRPEKNESYWISIKDYFTDIDWQKNTKVHFVKTDNRFDSSAFAALLRLGREEVTGLFLGPIPRDESLFSNLLPIVSLPQRIWVARTEYRQPKHLWPILNDCGRRISGDWILYDQSVVSFQDLRDEPWSTICDPGTCEDFDVWEWEYTLDDDRRRCFVELLNRTLRDQLYPEVQFWKNLGCYAFTCNLEAAPIKKSYRSVEQKSEITVVSKYTKESRSGKEYMWLRHLAFRGQFRLFEDQWYLEITPTYVFTSDGKHIDRFHESRLSTIKRIEGNRAVLSSIMLWADTLSQSGDLFRSSPKLGFGKLLSVELPIGIDDQGWSSSDPYTDADPEIDGLFTALLPKDSS